MTSISVSPSCRSSSAAQTPNQTATALALQAQPVGSPLYDAIIGQTAPGALQRLQRALGRDPCERGRRRRSTTRGCRARRCSTGSPRPYARAIPERRARPCRLTASRRRRQAYSRLGAGASTPGAISAATATPRPSTTIIGGFILGADATLYGRYRLGVAGGYTNSILARPARGSTGQSSSDLYRALRRRERRRAATARRRLLRLQPLRLGPLGRRSPASTRRRVRAMAATRRRPSARRAGGSPVAAPFVSAASVEPFVGVAGVDLHTASFTETPGPASLVGGSESYGYGITTLGLRGETSMFAAAPLTAQRHDRLAACFRRADAERDAGFRKRALDPVLDRRARRSRATRSPSSSASTAA